MPAAPVKTVPDTVSKKGVITDAPRRRRVSNFPSRRRSIVGRIRQKRFLTPF
jgi:hypothetical protein